MDQNDKIDRLTKKSEQQDEEIRVLKIENRACKDTMMTIRRDTKNDIAAIKDAISFMNLTTAEHSRQIQSLMDPPEIYYCAFKDVTNAQSASITYDSIFYARSNQGSGGLDTSSGLFTAGYPGTYEVSWALIAAMNAGSHVLRITLYKNGKTLDHPTIHESSYTGFDGKVADQGGRSVFMHLDLGETLSLHCDDCTAGAYYVTFCAKLLQFDQIGL